MALRLNKILGSLFFVLAVGLAQGQEDYNDEHRPGDKDYKSGEQFEKFWKRRRIVSAWQIGQLKEGALVVRLKTNQRLIDGLLKQGDTVMAEQKRLEAAAINVNTIKAYLNYYTFSKVYFIYSHSSDSLLKGVRSHIFLDSTLQINPAIAMAEKFYLLAERDYGYNSTIGFVPEDSARLVKEEGYAVKEMAMIVKNKYGHQLKRPFPFDVGDGFDPRLKPVYVEHVEIGGVLVPFNVSNIKTSGSARSERNMLNYKVHGRLIALYLPKYYTYKRISTTVMNLNDNFYHYYRSSPHLDEKRLDPAIKPFLY